MLADKDISIHLSCQQFECNSFEISPMNSVLKFESTRTGSDETCTHCGGKVHVYDNGRMMLKDMPLWHGVPLNLDVNHHRYRCTVCGRSFSEDICMRYPGTRITYRAAKWVQCVFAIGNQQKYQKNSALFPKPQFTFFSTI